MEYKKFIDTLSQNNANYNNPEQAITTANLCETISRDINTDSQRFIYELIQNADDASNDSGILDIQIEFVDEYIIVSHKGEPFSKTDIESISSAGDGTKAGDSNKTGFKGIGFKSVFSHSNLVIIKSGDYCFKFDKQHWVSHWNDAWGLQSTWQAGRKIKNKDENLKMPWQIIPIWTDLPIKLKNLPILNEYKVSTIIRYDKIEQLKKALNDLFSQSQIVLFLRSKHVKVILNTDEKLMLEKSVLGDITYLKRNGIILSEWLVKTEPFTIPENVQTEINADDKSPKKLKEAKRTEISFAIQMDKNKLKPVDKENRLIFTYLPTSINYDFPFLVNASFLTDAGRQHLHHDTFWNQWLFTQIPLIYFHWISKLADRNSKFNRQFLTVLPQKLNGFNKLENKFNEGFSEAIETIAFIPNLHGDLLKVSDALFDDTNISDFLSKKLLLNYINNETDKNYSVNSYIPYLKPISSLKQLGLNIFKVENLEGFFTSNTFSTEHKVEENFNLISFLHKQANNNQKNENENDWNYRLKNIPFIFDENKTLQKPELIYFPAVEFSDDFRDDLSIINKTVLVEIDKNNSIKSWLESLGVKEPTDVSFIEKTIISNEKFINSENSIKIGRYLYNAHKKGILTEKHYSMLSQVNFLTQKGTLKKPQDCYISDFYEPELKLEKFCEIDFFINTEYFEEKDLKSDWKSFFLYLKAKETIVWDKFEVRKNSINRLDYKYFENIIQTLEGKQEYNGRDLVYYGKNNYFGCLFYVNSFTVYNFSFIEYANDIIFSKLFWSNALNMACPHNEPDSVHGSSGAVGISHSLKSIFDTEYEGLFMWSIRNLEIFPTKNHNCKKSCEIFINNISQIDEIVGKYLPILAYNNIVSPEWQGILKFKEQLKLDDYLTILTELSQDTELTEDEQKENKKRVFLIYQKLADLYSNLHLNDKSKLKDWSNSNKLLARDGKYYLPKELSIVTIDGFNADNLIYTENKVDESIISLFDFWGVKVIDRVTPKFSNSMVSQESLRKQLEYIAPLIALVAVEKSKNKKEWEEEYSRICKKLSDITFYETTDILLTYGNEQDQQQRSTYSEGNKFYYVGNWYKPRVLDGLLEPLCKFLSIRYAERILTVLLSDTFAEGLKYLEEKGFDISLIPETLANPQILIPVEPDYSNRGYDISKEEIGKKGELFVYDYLKQVFKVKYGDSILETNDGFRISDKLEVIWTNKNFISKELYDFKILEAGKEIFIDSKATKYSKYKEDVALYITVNEVALMERAEKYMIARVYEALSDKSSVEFVKMQLDNVTE